jgi:hypothetical protein
MWKFSAVAFFLPRRFVDMLGDLDLDLEQFGIHPRQSLRSGVFGGLQHRLLDPGQIHPGNGIVCHQFGVLPLEQFEVLLKTLDYHFLVIVLRVHEQPHDDVERGRVHLPEPVLNFVQVLQMLEFVDQFGLFVEGEGRQQHRIDHHGGKRQKSLDPKRHFGEGLALRRRCRNGCVDARRQPDFGQREVHGVF